MGTRMKMLLRLGGDRDPIGIGVGEVGDLGQDGFDGSGGFPAPGSGCERVVQDHPWQVEGAWVGIGGHRKGTPAVLAPVAQLLERAGGCQAAGKIEDRRLCGLCCAGGHLLEDQRREIPWMQAVADLMAHAVEPDVFERAFFTP